MSVRLQEITPLTLEEWHQFASGFRKRNGFHHAGWIRALQETYHFPLRIYGVKDEETGKLVTALPFMRVISLRGKQKWICLPFTDHFPVLGDAVTAAEMVKALHTSGELKGVVEVRTELPADDAFHSSTNQVIHAIDLSVGEEALFDQVAKNHRKAIRQAERRGVEAEIDTSVEGMKAFYDLQLKTRRAKGLPTQPWKFFLAIQRNLLEGGKNGHVVLAKNKFVVIGGKVVLHWGNVMTGKFSASDYAFLSFRPNQFVYWQSLCWGIRNGFEVNDLGKTTLDNEGLCRYKRGWTAVEKPLRYTYLGVDSDIEIHEEGASGLIGLVSRVISRSPLFVSKLAGNLFYRFFA